MSLSLNFTGVPLSDVEGTLSLSPGSVVNSALVVPFAFPVLFGTEGLSLGVTS